LGAKTDGEGQAGKSRADLVKKRKDGKNLWVRIPESRIRESREIDRRVDLQQKTGERRVHGHQVGIQRKEQRRKKDRGQKAAPQKNKTASITTDLGGDKMSNPGETQSRKRDLTGKRGKGESSRNVPW